MASTRRVLGTITAAAALVGGLTGCEPTPPPPPQYVVNSLATAPDVLPGDGICEATAGLGDCTFPAAVEEADATGVAGATATVVLPPSEVPYPGIDGDIHNDVVIRAESAAVESSGGAIDVLAGGRLRVESVGLQSQVTVGGTFVADRTVLSHESLAALIVLPGGNAELTNSYVTGGAEGTVVLNDGVLALRYSTLDGGGTSVITTGDGASTDLTAAAILGIADELGATACAGTAPTSAGYNVVFDRSCALGGDGDVESAGGTELVPGIGSVRRDTVPNGEAGCGVDVVHDITGLLRPLDSDGDGLASCDAGAWESEVVDGG